MLPLALAPDTCVPWPWRHELEPVEDCPWITFVELELFVGLGPAEEDSASAASLSNSAARCWFIIKSKNTGGKFTKQNECRTAITTSQPIPHNPKVSIVP